MMDNSKKVRVSGQDIHKDFSPVGSLDKYNHKEKTMSVIHQIAFYQERRDEVPNQVLARQLAENKDREGLQEIADNLWNKNSSIRSDCLKVLYETGYIDPGLITGFADSFLRLIKDKNNRMVWGAMIALASIAHLCADVIWDKFEDVRAATEHGSVITVVSGVKTLAAVAATGEERRRILSPFLFDQIKSCIPRDVPTHAEHMLCAIDDSNRQEFLSIIESRRSELNPAQTARMKKVLKQLQSN